ncbi:MAG: hypothetical protein Q7T33_14165 [Dehalococcoidia bacterium]|nr:hypothetical protein [Dehalococcoidia bacterium]
MLADSPAGQRPAGYWAYEAPERPRKGVRVETWTHYQGGKLVTSELVADEPEAACLARLGLLEPWETAELTAIEQITNGTANDGADDDLDD